MERINYSSGAKWEEVVGYSRAVKLGNIVEVSGTVSLDDSGKLIGKDDAYAQTKFILEKIEKTLEQAGASLKDVVRTRMFVTNISLWSDFGKAHAAVFKEIRPVTTMVEVRALIGSEYMIEIEATAIIK